jgi:hypothetical protein
MEAPAFIPFSPAHRYNLLAGQTLLVLHGPVNEDDVVSVHMLLIRQQPAQHSDDHPGAGRLVRAAQLRHTRAEPGNEKPPASVVALDRGLNPWKAKVPKRPSK